MLTAEKLQEATFVRSIDSHDELDSTNDRALRLLAEGVPELPLLVVARRQRSGRGRGANAWWSADGALTFSLVVDHEPSSHLLPNGSPVSLVAGLAVAETLGKWLPALDVRLKWPNDVLLQGRKVCGILVEKVRDQPTLLVIGIGLNANNHLTAAPPDVRARATSMSAAAGKSFDLTRLLVELLRQLEQELGGTYQPHCSLPQRWRNHCALEGRKVTIQAGNRLLAGRCKGVGSDGALLLEGADGDDRCYAGVVTAVEGR